jgi:hypothetical protein
MFGNRKMCIGNSPLDAWETTKSFETLHYHFHFISRWPSDKMFENNIENYDDLFQNK